jgi:hypothetical protein
MATPNYIPEQNYIKDHEKHLLRHARERLQNHTDHSSLSPRELLICMIVEHAGGLFMGEQRAEVPGQEDLVIFNTTFGASLALPVSELSTQAVRQKLELAHQMFGVEWEE